MANKKGNRVERFLRFIYLKLFRINDTPQKIGLGLGLGIASGIIPGSGPLAALFLALVFKANRAAALIGSILTNTWLSILLFPICVKIGALILGIDWQAAFGQIKAALEGFRLSKLLSVSFLKVIFPAFLGYILVGVLTGLLAYICVILFLRNRKRQLKSK